MSKPATGTAPVKSAGMQRAKNFAIGGFSGMCATTVIQPADMVKVRIQILSGENPGQKFGPGQVARQIMAESGFPRGFYQGYDAAIMRQAVYTTARFGIFLSLSDYLREKNGGKNLSFGQKGAASLTAGCLASIVGTPADVILIRFQSDSTLPVEMRRNYKHVFDAVRRIPAEEGVLSLWKGGLPTVLRAMALNCALFSTYEETKERLSVRMPNNLNLAWFIASVVGGTLAAGASLPFDNAKTKMQKMIPNPDGSMPYKNIIDCMAKEIKGNGVTGLWAGLPTYIVRIAPHGMISLTVADQLRSRFM